MVHAFLKKHFNYIVLIYFLLFLIIALIEKFLTDIKYNESISINENINIQEQKTLKIILIQSITILLDIILLVYILIYSHEKNIIMNIILYFNIALIFILNLSILIICIKIKHGNNIDIYNENKKYLDIIDILNLISGIGPRVILFLYLIGFKLFNFINKKKIQNVV